MLDLALLENWEHEGECAGGTRNPRKPIKKSIFKGPLPLKILLLRPDAIGDMVLMIPLINTLKSHFPDAQLYTLQQGYTSPLLQEHPAISGVLIDRKKSGEAKGLRGFWQYAQWLREQRFDAVLMPYLEPYYARLMWAARIPIRIGDAQKVLLRPWLTHPIALDYRNVMRHECVQMAKLAEGLDPAIPFVSTMDLYLNATDRAACDACMHNLNITAPFILIHPASGGGNRPWSVAKYAALIAQILDKTPFHVVLTGAGKVEAHKVAAIMAQVHPTPHRDMARMVSAVDQTSLRTLMALIEKAEVVVGTDTGPTHIAAALKRPVLCISPTKFVKSLRWGPWETPRQIISAAEACDLVCRPYKCPATTCLDAIDTRRVFEALIAISREAHHGPMQSSLHIGILIRDEADKAYYLTFSEFLQKEGFKVWILKAPRSPWRLLRHIWAHDLCVIHSRKAPLGWGLLRQIAALRMYIPPVWTADMAYQIQDLERVYQRVFDTAH